jgi:hypothetical protein
MVGMMRLVIVHMKIQMGVQMIERILRIGMKVIVSLKMRTMSFVLILPLLIVLEMMILLMMILEMIQIESNLSICGQIPF